MPKTPKQPNKEDPEYLEKRKRNNEAIKKSREKAREKAAKTQERVEFLKDDNKKMEDKINVLGQEMKFLKDIFLGECEQNVFYKSPVLYLTIFQLTTRQPTVRSNPSPPLSLLSTKIF